MSQKSYRIKANVNEDTVLKVQMQQDVDFLEILSMKLSTTNDYMRQDSNCGILVGRVLANNAFGVENVKVSIFVPIDSDDSSRSEIKTLYPYEEVTDVNKQNIRYNLLPNKSDDECYQVVGTFPTKRYVLDNDTVIEVFDKYWKYTTVTNSSGDYMIYGLPTTEKSGSTMMVHAEVDLSDCGILSQKPIDMMFQGTDSSEFANPYQFKSSTNLDDLAQIIKEDKAVTIYPFWGDTDTTNGNNSTEIAISRCDIQLNYEFHPTCVFFGGTVTDTSSNIRHNCRPSRKSGYASQLGVTQGTIEMIRKTSDGYIEEYQISGNSLIDEDGVFCYQIPMNLDYITTDEFGNIVSTNDPKKGIPTRTSVRFRFSLQDTDEYGATDHRAKILVPNNPYLKNDKRTDEYSSGYSFEKSYEFGSATQDGDFRDLYWNKVYSVKSYIPRFYKHIGIFGDTTHSQNFSGLRSANWSENINPLPFNNLRIHLSFTYVILCLLSKIVANIIYVINKIVTGLSALTCFMKLFGHCIGLPKKAISSWANCIAFSMVSDNEEESEDTKIVEYYPGCGGQAKKWVQEDHPNYIVDTDFTELKDKIEQNLAQDNEVTHFDFYNDWINGCLYFPRWHWRKVKKKKFLFGLFSLKAQNRYCSCDDTSDGKWIWKTNACNIVNSTIVNNPHKNFKKVKIHGGIIKKKTNKAGLEIFYYASASENDTEILSDTTKPLYRLYATDIILLGALTDNDSDGIPQLFKYLPATTSNIPDLVVSLDEDGETYLESGMDWENNKRAEKDYIQYRKGLLYDLGCNKANTLTKSCVNTKRLSELGVVTDGHYTIQVPGNNEIGERTIDMDGMITHYEINDVEARAMFASLNHNGLTKFAYVKNKAYKIYDLQYVYPFDFDGMMEASAKKYANITDYQDKSYMLFRYGTNSFVFEGSSKIPQTNNSFYFYFGLNNGKTGIDKFLRNFYGTCSNSNKYTFVTEIDYTPSSSCLELDDEGDYIFDGVVSGTVTDILTPYSYELSDIYEIDVVASVSDVYDDTFVISGVPNDTYYLTVTDAKGNYEKQTINLVQDPISMDYSYTDLGDKYYGAESLFNLCSSKELYGEIDIYSFTIDEKEYKITGFETSIIKGRYILTGKNNLVPKQVIMEISVSSIEGDRTDISSFEECGCMGVNDQKTIQYIEEDNSIRIAIWVPGIYHVTLTEICHNVASDNTNTYDINIENGKPFEAFLNDVPLRMFATDKNHNLLPSGSPLDNGSYFVSKLEESDGDADDIGSGWLYYSTKALAYNFVNGASMAFNTDNIKYWENYINISYEEGLVSKFTLLTAIAYELQCIFNIAKGTLVSSDIENSGFEFSTIGGKEPVSYRLVRLNDNDVNEKTQYNEISKNVRATSDKAIYPTPYACDVVSRSYTIFIPSSDEDSDAGYYQRYGSLISLNNYMATSGTGIDNVDGFTEHWYYTGLGLNPKFSPSDGAFAFQGNYFATFTQNANYSVNSCKKLSKNIQEIPISANRLHKEVCINGAFNYLLTEWKDSNLRNFLRTEFVDARLDYNLLVISSPLTDLDFQVGGATCGPTIVYGDLINGITCAYHTPTLSANGETVFSSENYLFYDSIKNNDLANLSDFEIPKYTVLAPTVDDSELAKGNNNVANYSYGFKMDENSETCSIFDFANSTEETNYRDEKFYDAYIKCDTDKFDLQFDDYGNSRYSIRTASHNSYVKDKEIYKIEKGGDYGTIEYTVYNFPTSYAEGLCRETPSSQGEKPRARDWYPQVRFLNLFGLPSCYNLELSFTNCSYDTQPYVKKTYSGVTTDSGITYSEEPFYSVEGVVGEGDTETINLRMSGLYKLVEGSRLALRRQMTDSATTENSNDGTYYNHLYIGNKLAHMEVAVQIKDDDTNLTHRQNTVKIFTVPLTEYQAALSKTLNGSIEKYFKTLNSSSRLTRFGFYSSSKRAETYNLGAYTDKFWKETVEGIANSNQHKKTKYSARRFNGDWVTHKDWNMDQITDLIGISAKYDSADGWDRHKHPYSYKDYQYIVARNGKAEEDITVRFHEITLGGKGCVEMDVEAVQNDSTFSYSGYTSLYPSQLQGVVDGFNSTYDYTDNPFHIDCNYVYAESAITTSSDEGITDFETTGIDGKTIHSYSGPIRTSSRLLAFNDDDDISNAIANGEYYWYSTITSSATLGYGDLVVVAETLYVNNANNCLSREIKVFDAFDIIKMKINGASTTNPIINLTTLDRSKIVITFNTLAMTELYGEDWYDDTIVIDLQIGTGGNAVYNYWYQISGLGEDTVQGYNGGKASLTYGKIATKGEEEITYTDDPNPQSKYDNDEGTEKTFKKDGDYVVLTIYNSNYNFTTLSPPSEHSQARNFTNVDDVSDRVLWLYIGGNTSPDAFLV